MNYVEGALQGNQLAGARLIRLLEEEGDGAMSAVQGLYPHAGRAYLLGITGPPGAGKSTLVDRIIGEFRRRDMTVGVVAVDPSSPFSGGAILGDRVRMQNHAADPGVFVRSMATRGHLGGLSRATGEAVLVLDAMGFDVVLLETVGVGQDEVEIVDLAHTTAVVCLPGMGDDIQAMKAGIMEIGDLFVVNKADKDGADQVVRHLSGMLEFRTSQDPEWTPPVLKTVASRGEGIEALVDSFLAHRDHLVTSGRLGERASRREEQSFRRLVMELLASRVFGEAEGSGLYPSLLEELLGRRIDPYAAAEKLLSDAGFPMR